SGANIGAVVAPIMVPAILGWYGWHEVFIVTGAIGFIWLVFRWIFYERPERHKQIRETELSYINSDGEDPSQAKGSVGWMELLRVRQTWSFVIGKFLTDPIWYFFLFWLPAYFNTTFHLDLRVVSLPLVIVYSATTVGSIGGGYLSS